MKDLPLLSTLGFSERESQVYTALLNGGIVSLSRLSLLSGVHRPALYATLPKLVKEGLVTEVPVGKTKKYKASSPLVLKKKVKKVLGQLDKDLQDLHSIYEHHNTKPYVTFTVGKKGYNKLFDDIATSMKRGETYLRYSARQIGEGNFAMSPLYKAARKHKNIERLVITSAEKAKTKRKRLDRFVKVVPQNFDMFDDNVSQMIYANKVAYIDHDSESTFIIESEKIARFQRKLFRLLWKYLKEQ